MRKFSINETSRIFGVSCERVRKDIAAKKLAAESVMVNGRPRWEISDSDIYEIISDSLGDYRKHMMKKQ